MRSRKVTISIPVDVSVSRCTMFVVSIVRCPVAPCHQCLLTVSLTVPVWRFTLIGPPLPPDSAQEPNRTLRSVAVGQMGTDRDGTGWNGTDGTGRDGARWDRTGRDGTGRDRTGWGGTGRDGTDGTGWDETSRDESRRDETRRDETKRDETGWGRDEDAGRELPEIEMEWTGTGRRGSTVRWILTCCFTDDEAVLVKTPAIYLG